MLSAKDEEKLKKIIFRLIFASLIAVGLFSVIVVLFFHDFDMGSKIVLTVALVVGIDLIVLLALLAKHWWLKLSTWAVSLITLLVSMITIWVNPGFNRECGRGSRWVSLTDSTLTLGWSAPEEVNCIAFVRWWNIFENLLPWVRLTWILLGGLATAVLVSFLWRSVKDKIPFRRSYATAMVTGILGALLLGIYAAAEPTSELLPRLTVATYIVSAISLSITLIAAGLHEKKTKNVNSFKTKNRAKNQPSLLHTNGALNRENILELAHQMVELGESLIAVLSEETEEPFVEEIDILLED